MPPRERRSACSATLCWRFRAVIGLQRDAVLAVPCRYRPAMRRYSLAGEPTASRPRIGEVGSRGRPRIGEVGSGGWPGSRKSAHAAG